MKSQLLVYTSLFLLLLSPMAKAQLKCPPISGGGEGLDRFDVTAGLGLTMLYGDINATSNMGFGLFLKGDYKLYKGLYVGLEGQFGKLKASGMKRFIPARIDDFEPREVENNYKMVALNVTVYPYRFFVTERDLIRKGFFERNILNGLNFGIGAGGLFSSYGKRTITNTYLDHNGMPSSFDEGWINGPHKLVPALDAAGNPIPGAPAVKEYRKTSRSKILPVVNIGLSIPVNKYTTGSGRYYSVVINSQFNFSADDELDSYDPLTPAGVRPNGAKNDMYNFTNVGVKYTF